MRSVPIENANLPALIGEMRSGEEIVLTERAHPVAKLVSIAPMALNKKAAALKTRAEALESLREVGGLACVISDPKEWQKQVRHERSLPNPIS